MITNIGSLIVLFGLLWWAFAFMFAYVITNTWGYQLKGFRNLQSAVLQMLATMVLASNEDPLTFVLLPYGILALIIPDNLSYRRDAVCE